MHMCLQHVLIPSSGCIAASSSLDTNRACIGDTPAVRSVRLKDVIAGTEAEACAWLPVCNLPHQTAVLHCVVEDVLMLAAAAAGPGWEV